MESGEYKQLYDFLFDGQYSPEFNNNERRSFRRKAKQFEIKNNEMFYTHVDKKTHNINDIIDLVKNDNPKMLKQFIDSYCIFKNKYRFSLIIYCKLNYLVLDKTFMQFGHDFTMKKYPTKVKLEYLSKGHFYTEVDNIL